MVSLDFRPNSESDRPAVMRPHLIGALALRTIFDARHYAAQVGKSFSDESAALSAYLETPDSVARNPCVLFDAHYYLSNNPHVADAGLNALLHFVSEGAQAGLKPHPLFDTLWYKQTNPDIGEDNPLAHYMYCGAAQLRQPHPLFDAEWYVRRYPESAEGPLAHYLQNTTGQLLQPHPLFDPVYYLRKHADIANAGVEALSHYVQRGHLELRHPHPLFDTAWYRERYPDVEGWNPLAHYVLIGAAERRDPHPLFDARYYVGNYPEAARNPLAHYVTHSRQQILQAHPLFDPEFYLARYKDVAEAKLDPLMHYVQRGNSEVRDPNPAFDAAWYLTAYPDVKERGLAPLIDYVRGGRTRQTRPHPGTNLDGESRVSAEMSALISSARNVSAQQDAVAIVCWDGAHNPIGRAKVLYDILSETRPVFMFSYLFEDFGGQLWAPLRSERFKYLGIPWNQRSSILAALVQAGVQFSEVWICKPRLPGFILASHIGAYDARVILDIDDNEEHFAKSEATRDKAYGLAGYDLGVSILEKIPARTVASPSLQALFGGELVRHARRAQPTRPITINPDGVLRIGFLGSVRSHKNVVGAAQAIRAYANASGRRLSFHVYGDVAPASLKSQLEANGAVLHDNVPINQAGDIVASCAVMITGFPPRAAEHEAVTRYQVSAKIGDALASGRPVLAPLSESVSDLTHLDGLYLFTADTFALQLERALAHTGPISLPEQFSFETAAKAFAKAEARSETSARAREVFAALKDCEWS